MTPDIYLGPRNIDPAKLVASSKPLASLPDKTGSYTNPTLGEVVLNVEPNSTRIRIQTSRIDEIVDLSDPTNPATIPFSPDSQLVITKSPETPT